MRRSCRFVTSLAIGIACVGGPGSYIALTASSASASLLSVESSHPVVLEGCGNYAAEIAYITYGGSNYGLTQLSYSSCTRNAWGYGYTYTTCQATSAVTGCVYDALYKSPSTYEADCVSGYYGQPQNNCNTAQATDAGITSYSYGEVYFNSSGSFFASGQTAAY
jgi:hypothetical protein